MMGSSSPIRWCAGQHSRRAASRARSASPPNARALNGVLRVGFVNNPDGDYHLDIKAVALIATVTGTD